MVQLLNPRMTSGTGGREWQCSPESHLI